MCLATDSGYYAWRRRGPSRRALENARLGTLIVASHHEGRGTYGSPRVLDDLREAGEHVSRKRVARLMKERGLVGEMPKRWRHPSAAPSDGVSAPNTLDRGFNVSAPNRVWASDITYIRTGEGWLYLAVVPRRAPLPGARSRARLGSDQADCPRSGRHARPQPTAHQAVHEPVSLAGIHRT